MKDKKPLLSICIPTYNREKFLKQSLNRLLPQIKQISRADVELLISDNCSPDNTYELVMQFIAEGNPIRYIRNEKNIGADANFIQCFKNASGKYIWLLGDDDFILPNSLNVIIDILKLGTFGLIHLQINAKERSYSILTDSAKFISKVSYWATYISSNIVLAKYVNQIDLNKYIGTFFLQVPVYLEAALCEQSNVLVHDRMFEDGADTKASGGYNYFQVFIVNFLKIWQEFVSHGKLSRLEYEKVKYDIFRHHILGFVSLLLFQKDIGRYKVDNAWKIIFKYYGLYPYFYIGIIHLKLSAIFRNFKN